MPWLHIQGGSRWASVDTRSCVRQCLLAIGMIISLPGCCETQRQHAAVPRQAAVADAQDLSPASEQRPGRVYGSTLVGGAPLISNMLQLPASQSLWADSSAAEAGTAPVSCCTPLVDTVLSTPGLGIMGAMLQAADVQLDGFPATVLAPTDTAVLAGLSLLNISVPVLFNNTSLLGNIVRQHIIPVALSLQDLARSRTDVLVTLLINAPLNARWQALPGTGTLNLPNSEIGGIGSLTVSTRRSTAGIGIANIQACSSIVHVLTHLLLPPLPSSSSKPVGPGTAQGSAALGLLRQYDSQALRLAPTPALGCCSTSSATSVLETAQGRLSSSQRGLVTILSEVAAAGTAPTGLDRCQTLPEVLQSISELSILASIINATGPLGAEFNNTLLQATVFAPSNEAFLRLFPETALSRLLADAADPQSPLEALVLLQTVPSPVHLHDMTDGLKLPSFLSSATQLQQGSGLLVVRAVNKTATGVLVQSPGSTAAILVPDIPACDSVVHIVDNLLLQQPPGNTTFLPSYQDVLASLPRGGTYPLADGGSQGLSEGGSQSQSNRSTSVAPAGAAAQSAGKAASGR